MGRRPCCSLDEGVNKGSWTAEEDMMLADHIKAHGERKWSSIPKQTGLKRCGKSCRLRWLNYLRPNIKRGNITHEEEDLIIRLHKLLGNRWSLIAGRIPGRTDNEIKNYWNGHLCKKKSKPENTKIGAKEIPSNEAKLEEGHSRYDYSKNKPESSDGSLLSSSTTSTTTTKHEDFSELLMEFYTRELSLSEFLDTDFTKFSSMISTATSTTATTTSQLVSMVRGDQMYQTQLHYSINEAEAPVGDDEVQFNMLNSQEIMQNSIGEDPQSDSNIGFELAAAFTDLEAEEELYWSITI